MLQFRIEDVVEDINEAHVGAWAEMLQKSNPPLSSTTHLSAYMDVFTLSKHVFHFSNEKIKNVVGYQLKVPKMTLDVLQDIVDKFKAEGSWPRVD